VSAPCPLIRRWRPDRCTALSDAWGQKRHCTINANTGDRINIIGVVLDGTGITGTTGIQFNSGGSLTVRDSVIRNFGFFGISFAPNTSSPSQLYLSNTLVSDNDLHGIIINPTGSGTTNGVLDHVDMENNSNDGLLVLNATQTVSITVSESVSANNGAAGIFGESDGAGPVNIMVRTSTVANNGVDGLGALGTGATIRVTRSTMTGNATAWASITSGIVTSYADNNIDGNGAANSEPSSPLSYK
jgi:hypothetical protein